MKANWSELYDNFLWLWQWTDISRAGVFLALFLKEKTKKEIFDEGLKGGNIHRDTIILIWQKQITFAHPHSFHRDKNWGLIDYTEAPRKQAKSDS